MLRLDENPGDSAFWRALSRSAACVPIPACVRRRVALRDCAAGRAQDPVRLQRWSSRARSGRVIMSWTQMPLRHTTLDPLPTAFLHHPTLQLPAPAGAHLSARRRQRLGSDSCHSAVVVGRRRRAPTAAAPTDVHVAAAGDGRAAGGGGGAHAVARQRRRHGPVGGVRRAAVPGVPGAGARAGGGVAGRRRRRQRAAAAGGDAGRRWRRRVRGNRVHVPAGLGAHAYGVAGRAQGAKRCAAPSLRKDSRERLATNASYDDSSDCRPPAHAS